MKSKHTTPPTCVLNPDGSVSVSSRKLGLRETWHCWDSPGGFRVEGCRHDGSRSHPWGFEGMSSPLHTSRSTLPYSVYESIPAPLRARIEKLPDYRYEAFLVAARNPPTVLRAPLLTLYRAARMTGQPLLADRLDLAGGPQDWAERLYAFPAESHAFACAFERWGCNRWPGDYAVLRDVLADRRALRVLVHVRDGDACLLRLAADYPGVLYCPALIQDIAGDIGRTARAYEEVAWIHNLRGESGERDPWPYRNEVSSLNRLIAVRARLELAVMEEDLATTAYPEPPFSVGDGVHITNRDELEALGRRYANCLQSYERCVRAGRAVVFEIRPGAGRGSPFVAVFGRTSDGRWELRGAEHPGGVTVAEETVRGLVRAVEEQTTRPE